MKSKMFAVFAVFAVGCSTPRADVAQVERPAPEAPIELRAQRRNTSPVTAKAASPVARQVVVGTERGRVTVWDTKTARLLRTLRPGGAPVRSLAVSRDGARVAVADEGGAISVYPIRGGEPLELVGAEGARGERTCAVRFSPRPDELAAACGGSVEVWDTSDAVVTARIELGDSILAVGHARDGAVLLYSSRGGLVEWSGGDDVRAVAERDLAAARVSISLAGDMAAVETRTSLELVSTEDGATMWREEFFEDAEVNASAFAPSGELIWTDTLGHMGTLDTSTLEVVGRKSVSGLGSSTSSIVVSGAGGEITASWMYGLTVLTRQGENVSGIGGSAEPLTSLQTSADGRLLTWVDNVFVTTFDLSTLEVVGAFEDGAQVAGAALSPGGDKVAAWGRLGTGTYLSVSDSRTGAYVDAIRTSWDEGCVGAAFASDDELWTASRHHIDAWRIRGDDAPIATFTPRLDGAEIESLYATRAGQPLLRLSDGRVGELGPGGEITRWLTPSEDEPEVARYDGLTVTRDLEMLLLERGGVSARMMSSGEQWVMWTPDGLFAASAEPSGLLHGVQGDSVVDLDQLALERNRPDVVFSRLGLGAADLHGALEGRWRLRLSRAGLTPDDLDDAAPRPRVAIVSARRSMDDADVLELEAEVRAHAELRSLQISVNGVGLFTGEGAPLSGREVRLKERVRLSTDYNTVEVTAFDARGRESLRARRQFYNGYPPQAERTLYFMGFGISDYASDDIVDLSWAHEDARNLAEAFGKMSSEGSNRLDRVVSRAWIDAEVTPEALAEARALLEESTPDDVVVLFVAGHGVYSEGADPTYYFLTHGTDLDDLEGTALRFEQLEGLLDGIGSRRKLMLMDTCQSGELDAEPGERARGVLSSPIKTRAPLGSQHRRYIWRDLRRRTGAIVISSSRGDEPSIESDAMRNGAFTEAIIEAITDDFADEQESPDTGYGKYLFTTTSLYAWLERRVPELTGDRQHPVVDRDNVHVQIELPKVTPLASRGE